MATQRQIEANRRNALKSKGPLTREGKARSSKNAMKHGLSSRLKAISSPEELDVIAQQIRVAFPALSESAVRRLAAVELEIAHARGKIGEAHRTFHVKIGTGDLRPGEFEAIQRMSRYERRAVSRRRAIHRDAEVRG